MSSFVLIQGAYYHVSKIILSKLSKRDTTLHGVSLLQLHIPLRGTDRPLGHAINQYIKHSIKSRGRRK